MTHVTQLLNSNVKLLFYKKISKNFAFPLAFFLSKITFLFWQMWLHNTHEWNEKQSQISLRGIIIYCDFLNGPLHVKQVSAFCCVYLSPLTYSTSHEVNAEDSPTSFQICNYLALHDNCRCSFTYQHSITRHSKI